MILKGCWWFSSRFLSNIIMNYLHRQSSSVRLFYNKIFYLHLAEAWRWNNHDDILKKAITKSQHPYIYYFLLNFIAFSLHLFIHSPHCTHSMSPTFFTSNLQVIVHALHPVHLFSSITNPNTEILLNNP